MPQNLTDEQLVALVCDADKHRYAELIRRYEKKLFRYALHLLGDEHMAEDVVQESFIKAYTNLRSFDTKRQFSSWMYRIVHNQAITVVSSRKNHTIQLDAATLDTTLDVEAAFIHQESLDQVRSCIAALPVLYKEPLILFYLEEKSYEEISDILRLPVGTVGKRIQRAKNLMRKVCQKKL